MAKETAAERLSTPRQHRRQVAFLAFGWLGLAIGAVFFAAAVWVRRTFGSINVDQLLMHLPGAGGAEPTGVEANYATSFIWQVILLPLAGVMVFAVLCHIVLAWYRRNYRRPRAAAPTSNTALRLLIPSAVSVISVVVGLGFFAQTVGISAYLRSSMSTLSMADYYVVPSAGPDTAELVLNSDGERQNLVVIYLESIEDAFSEADTFGVNLLEPLEEATAGWDSIPDLYAYEGGGWTMAGLVGTQCGIPLRGAGIGVNDINSNEIGAESSSYLPGATCLGDVLESEGYTNVFLGGADATFASKADFLTGHGFHAVKDLQYWVADGEEELSAWGLSDRALMERAKAEVAALHESGQPFHLSLLTLDSHEPAHLFEYCEPQMDDELADAIRCSIEQVADFIGFMEDNGYLADTTVVVMGDHPKMLAEGGHFWDELSSRDDRPLFNRIWSPTGELTLVPRTDQLSMFATILDLLEITQGDRAGVGVSALVTTPWDSLEMSPESYEELISSRSATLYQWLWEPDGLEVLQTMGAG